MKRLVVLMGFVCPIFVFAATGDVISSPDLPPPVGLEDDSKEEVVITKEAINTAVAKNAETTSLETTKKESEIPVLTNTKAAERETSNPYVRLFFSFLVIAVTGAGLFFAAKWWKKRHGGANEDTKIRVLTEHHLGPRKSLAIVRVAGESILIGITDQNISMLKSLSLIDDEFADVASTQFARTLADKAVIEPTQTQATARAEIEEFAFSQIKDKVSQRIKEMGPIG